MNDTKNVKLLNWDSTKGNPYSYQIAVYEDKITQDTTWEIAKQPNKRLSQLVQKVNFNHHIKTVSLMDISQNTLLMGATKKGFYKYFDKNHINSTKPITVWLDYPFSEPVKVTIYPLIREFEGTKRHIVVCSVGYIVWQIARVYAEIYQNHHEEVGIWGHGFDDLYLERVGIYKRNVLLLSVGS